MDILNDSIDLFDLHLDHSPLAVTGTVTVSKPNIRDNSGLAERLAKAVARKWRWSEVDVPAGLAANLGDLFNTHGYDLWTAVALLGDRPRIVTVRPSGPDRTYGLAVDLGSTTLVMALVDLTEPRVVECRTLANPQTEFGADILTRAHFAERPGGLEALTSSVRAAINDGLADLCRHRDIMPDNVVAVTMAGNTAMTHLLLKLPLKTLIREPYVPVMNHPRGLIAQDIQLNTAPGAPVWIMPNKGAYFGGDLMAGILVSGMIASEKTCLLVDVGTNAEVVLGQKDWLLGAAGAAGPALEGGVVERGMVAAPGVIDRVRIDRDTGVITYRTINDEKPRGICGSGLIDLFAELFLSGVIDFQGKLTISLSDPRRLETDEGPAFIVVPAEETAEGEPITISEVELDILTRSKAGMYTILSTIMISVGMSFEDIDRFYVAGTFGQYIDPKMAVAVGMIPDIPLERFVPLGNSSLKGAVLALISGQARDRIIQIWRQLTYLEMNVNQDLMNRFSAARFIPHTDRERFPSVGTLIK
jgi:uncharacterized 2Fe-2S/4Fe-4S cluster protein (DUF4445 family)